jgi:putative Holliday junction resolvase
VRFLGIDYGARRIGLALSDSSGTLARPWQTVQAGAVVADSARGLVDLIRALPADEAVAAIVVGVPKRLDGRDTDQTAAVRELIVLLSEATGLPVHEQDERLSSHEAEELLAARERDWRVRKAKLDAAAAAVILQDYLNRC